jgi:hypothetical protein
MAHALIIGAGIAGPGLSMALQPGRHRNLHLRARPPVLTDAVRGLISIALRSPLGKNLIRWNQTDEKN